MTEEERQKQIEDAGIEYTIANKPRCVAGDNFADLARQFNKNLDFEAGAKWSDKHPVNYDGKALLYVCNKSHENGYKEAVNKMIELLNKRLDNYNIHWVEDEYCWTKEMFLEQLRKTMMEGRDND